RHILDAEIALILDLGVELRAGVAVGRDLPLDEVRKQFDAVFLAIGAQKAARIGCPGEEAAGVYGGVDFLRLVNGGEAVDLASPVVVVGGGNTAIDAARVARRLGADATLLYRRTRAEMPASAEEIEQAEEEGVHLELLAAPAEIQAKNGRVAGVLCQRMRLGEPDASGRRRPVPVPGDTFVLPAGSVILAVSQEVDWSGLEMLREITSGPPAEPVAPKLLAGGDVRGLGLVAEALLQGRQAAEALHARLRGLPPPEAREGETVSPDRLHLETVACCSRNEAFQKPPTARLEEPWSEAVETLPLDQAVAEAERCIGCGESFIKQPKTHPLHVLRRFTQIGIGTLLFNSFWGVLATKAPYDGPLRNVCVPGLNCHSCPTALMGCPIGMLQHFSATHRFPWFLIGFLGIIGLLSGRFTCGWLCPWGAIQDLLHRVKRWTVRLPWVLNYLKYAMLVVVAIIIPYFTYQHWFSKLCPCGALIAGIPWALWNPIDPNLEMTVIPDGAIAGMFWLKMWILGAFLLLFLFIKRPFCRTICPLGAIYALFNRVSLVSLRKEEGCVECGQCRAVCPVDIDPSTQINSEGCIKCLECTQCRHMKFEWKRFWIRPRKRRVKRPLAPPVVQPAARETGAA
ncbi:MAG: 4Fe-4S binding protein, partial [Candidatus Zixiibacteriota bacterium]